MFDRPDMLVQPEAMVGVLGELPIAAGLGMLIAGVVCVSHGYRLHRAGIVAAAGMGGAWFGYRMGEPMGGEVILAICCGVMLAAAAWPLMRWAMVGLAGLAGGLAVAHVGSVGTMQLSQQVMSDQAVWAAAALGLAIAAALAGRTLELSVVMATSIGGAVLMAIGLTAVALHVPGVNDLAVRWLMQQQAALPIAVAVTSLLGLIMQNGSRGRTPPPEAPHPPEQPQ